jgi:hypothetical protein
MAKKRKAARSKRQAQSERPLNLGQILERENIVASATVPTDSNPFFHAEGVHFWYQAANYASADRHQSWQRKRLRTCHPQDGSGRFAWGDGVPDAPTSEQAPEQARAARGLPTEVGQSRLSSKTSGHSSLGAETGVRAGENGRSLLRCFPA